MKELYLITHISRENCLVLYLEQRNGSVMKLSTN